MVGLRVTRHDNVNGHYRDEITRETNQSLLATGCVGVMRTRPFEAIIAPPGSPIKQTLTLRQANARRLHRRTDEH